MYSLELIEDNKLILFLQENCIMYKKNIDLKYNSYLKTKFECETYIIPLNTNQLKKTVIYLKSNKLEYQIIGSATNILPLDCVTYNVIISTILLDSIILTEKIAIVDAGVKVEDFVKLLSSNEIMGYEGLEGIPGTIAGAIYMNAGAYGYTISDFLISVKVIDNNGVVQTLSKEDCAFEHRKSIFFQRKYDILSANFLMKPGKHKEIYSNLKNYHHSRHLNLEYSYPNLGSIYSLSNVDLYDAVKLNKRFMLKILYKISKKIFNSRFLKIYRRMNSGKDFFHSFLEKEYIKLFNMNLHSSFTINTYANKNNKSYELLDYTLELKKILNDRYVLENEVLIGRNIKIQDSIEYEKCLKIYNEIVKK